MKTEESRKKAVAFAVALAESTPLAPTAYELLLLGKYVRGVLTLEEVEQRMAQHRR